MPDMDSATPADYQPDDQSYADAVRRASRAGDPAVPQQAALSAIGVTPTVGDPDFMRRIQGVLASRAEDAASPTGALAKHYGDTTAQLTTAQQAQKARMEQAMAILQQTRGGQTANLPLLAFGAAMLHPTRGGTFGESLGQGVDAAIPQIGAQRQKDFEYAKALSSLGIEEGSQDVQNVKDAQKSFDDYYKEQGEGLGQAATMATWQQRGQNQMNIAELRAATMKDVAGTKDVAQRLAIATRAYMSQMHLDEKTAKDLATLDLQRQGLEIKKTGETGLNQRELERLASAEARAAVAAGQEKDLTIALSKARRKRGLPDVPVISNTPGHKAPDNVTAPLTQAPPGKPSTQDPAPNNFDQP